MPRTALPKPNSSSVSPAVKAGDDAASGGADIDAALVRRCACRDTAALQELVRRYQHRLFHFLRQMLGSTEDAEEAAQDVFLRVWQQAERFEGRASFVTWLFRIATNIAYDRLRHRKAQPATTDLLDESGAMTIDPADEALDALERQERASRLAEALGALRDDDRLVLYLYYGEELGYPEIGRITGLSYPVLKVRLMRARKRLHAILGARPFEENE